MNIQTACKRTVIAIYFLLVLCLAIYNYLKPYYSYDLVPYIASTLSLEDTNSKQVHDDTYKIIKKSLPPEIYSQFVSGEFGKTMYNDEVSFTQQLNYYTIKPLYIFTIFVLYKLGIGIVTSINLISVLSFIGISFILFLFIKKLNSGYLGLIVLSLLMICQPFIIMAGRNTPDALSAFVIMLALYLTLNTNLKVLSGILLVLSIAIRPDNLIMVGALLVYFGILSPPQYRIKLVQGISFLILSMVVYFSINIFEHSYGWKTLFTIAFLHFVARPADVHVQLSLKDYLKVLITNGIAVLSTHVIYFVVFGLIGLVSRVKKAEKVFSHLIIITNLVMIFYFILFPSKEVDRYFVTEYLVILILTLRILCDNISLKSNLQVSRKAI